MIDKFTVQTEGFEGPLELLLHLVEKRKLFISDVTLAEVADEYVEHVNKLEVYSIPNAANFILVASTLVLIKSKSLLPNLSLTEEEQYDVEELNRRLKEYKKIRALSNHVRERFGKNMIFEKLFVPSADVVFIPSDKISKKSLCLAIKSVIENLPVVPKLTKAVVDKVKSLDETITDLSKRIQTSIKLNFNEFSKSKGNAREKKLNAVISFLAMLELVKQGLVVVKQDRQFSDIEIESQEASTPNYS